MFQCKMSKVSSGLKKNSSFSGVTVAKTSQSLPQVIKVTGKEIWRTAKKSLFFLHFRIILQDTEFYVARLLL